MQHMKVLVVLTSHDQLAGSGKKTGFWLETLAAPYYVFTQARVDITLASAKGGQPPLDPRSNQPGFRTADTSRFDSDAAAARALANTVKLAEVGAEYFDGAFFAGGHGVLWDLTNDRNAHRIIENMLAAKRPVALVCHAPGILTHVMAPNGDPITEGRTVTGFTNSEEADLHLLDVLPYSLEHELKKQGAIFSAKANGAAYVVQDGLLITGQNPASSNQTALRLLDLLQADGN
jgi:putative intracellular protease/amidase